LSQMICFNQSELISVAFVILGLSDVEAPRSESTFVALFVVLGGSTVDLHIPLVQVNVYIKSKVGGK
jgi:hypothetical protein